jgi:hypothetical protein
MKTINTITSALEIQAGLYKFNDVVRFEDTSKFPIALVNHKRNVTFTAVKDAKFFLKIESLYNKHSTGPKGIRPEELKGKLINVKNIDDDKAIIEGKLEVTQIVDWEIINKFSLYELYKQENGMLVIPDEELNEYIDYENLIEAEFNQIEEAIEIAEIDAFDDDIEDEYDEISE